MTVTALLATALLATKVTVTALLATTVTMTGQPLLLVMKLDRLTTKVTTNQPPPRHLVSLANSRQQSQVVSAVSAIYYIAEHRKLPHHNGNRQPLVPHPKTNSTIHEVACHRQRVMIETAAARCAALCGIAAAAAAACCQTTV